MNKNQVISIIEKIGKSFGGVMEDIFSKEYAAGYRRAIADMVELFSKTKMDDDSEAVRHGEWIDMDAIGISHGFIYKCSVCGKEVEDNFISCHKFCLHCGADMRGGSNG